MSNFTKSIVYSTTVLAAGVVAIFAIYNNVSTSPDGSSVADITPAAGVSSIGIGYDKAIENVSNTIEASTEAAKEKAGEMKDSAKAAMEPIKSKMDDAGAVVGETVEQAGEAIEETFTPEDTIEQIEPAHEEIKKQIKGSSGPHALPEKSGALHMQRSPYLILAGSNSTSGPSGVDVGNIGDILDQATKDAQARAGKHSKNSKSYSKADKKRLLKGMTDSSFAERNGKQKKPQMTQQAFIMQQALKAAMAKKNGTNAQMVNKNSVNKNAIAQSLTKNVSLTSEGKTKALVSGHINAIDFVAMAQQAAADSQNAANDTQNIADQAAIAAAAAVQASDDAQSVADQSAAAAAASQAASAQAQADYAAAQQATAQAQADQTAAQQATAQAQADHAAAQQATAQAQAAETTSQTNATNADAAATQAEADAAANPMDPALQQAAIDARALSDQAQLDYAAAQQTTANAQAAETSAANTETAAVNNETAASNAETAAINNEATAQTTAQTAANQAAADTQVANADQQTADGLLQTANGAVQQANQTQGLADQLNQVIANNPTGTGADLNNATQQIGGSVSQALASTAGNTPMEPGVLLDQALTGAQTTVQQSAGNIAQAAIQAATGSTANIQQIVQNATDPQAAKAAARGFLTGQISGAMGGAGLGTLTQGLQASFAGALGGDMSTGAIISQVIQAVVALPTEIIPIIPNIPFVGDAITGILNAATSILTSALTGPIQEVLNYSGVVTNLVNNPQAGANLFGDPAVMQATTDLINAGGNPGGAGSMVTQSITSVVQQSSQ